MPRIIKVKIRNFEVSPHQCKLSKDNKDECKWVNETDTDAAVIFKDGSPFGLISPVTSFTVPSRGEKSSGPPNQHQGGERKYNYEVVVAAAATAEGSAAEVAAVIDPEVIVDR